MQLAVTDVAQALARKRLPFSLQQQSKETSDWKGSVITDSRNSQCNNEWFVTLNGSISHGWSYVDDALANGAKGIITDSKNFADVLDDSKRSQALAAVYTHETLDALHALAALARDTIAADKPVVGITGSCGKSSVKELTYICLMHALSVAGTTGTGSNGSSVMKTRENRNSQVGVPLELLDIPITADAFVLELGMSKAGEMSKLVDVAEPTVRAITNVGPSHLEGVNGQCIEGVAQAKNELLLQMRDWTSKPRSFVPVLNADDPHVINMLTASNSCAPVTFGTSTDASIRVTDVRTAPDGVHFILRNRLQCSDGEESQVHLPSLGTHEAINAACAVACAQMACSQAGIQARFADLCNALDGFEKPMNQLIVQWSANLRNLGVLDDSQNMSLDSLQKALDAVQQAALWHAFDRRADASSLHSHAVTTAALLGDMNELGEQSALLHRQAIELAVASVDHVVTAGERMAEAAREIDHASPNSSVIHAFSTKTSAAEVILRIARMASNDVIVVVKGSRAAHMEHSAQYLINGN